jgi:putative ABC transport system substrate-binding protein
LAEGRDLDIQFVMLPPIFAPVPLDSDVVDGLLATRPAVIVGLYSTAFTNLAERVTDRPLVFYNFQGDPVAAGLVQSLRRPGGNVTGAMIGMEDIQRRQWALVKELAPRMKRGALIVDANVRAAAQERAERDPIFAAWRSASDDRRRAMANEMGIEVSVISIPAKPSRDEIVAAFSEARPQGVVITMRPAELPRELMAYLKALRIPAMTSTLLHVHQGALVGTSYDYVEGEAYAATVVKRILLGETPATIPVYRGTRFGLAINRTTAREMGIEVPPSLLIQAEIVE